MKIGKRLLCALLAAAMGALLFTGCSKKEETPSSLPSSSQVSQAPEEPYKIGLIQYMENPFLDTIREAFIARLEEWGYDETKVNIDYQNAGGDSGNANAICKKFVEDKVDMIAAIATPAAQAAVSSVKDTQIKVLFAAVSDPGKDLNLQNAQAPEGNVTGTSHQVPVAATLDLALKADPKLKTLGLLYDPGESGSVAAVEAARKYGEEKGVAVVESTVSDIGGLQQAATDLCAKADAVFTPIDNTVASSTAVVAEAARKAKTPWYAGTDSMVRDGALAAIGMDYTEMGNKNADMAVQLIEGKAVSQVPVFSFESSQTYINQNTVDALGITLPGEVTESAVFFTDQAAN